MLQQTLPPAPPVMPSGRGAFSAITPREGWRRSPIGRIIGAIANVILLIIAVPLVLLLIAWKQLAAWVPHALRQLATELPLSAIEKHERRTRLLNAVRSAAAPAHPALAQSASAIALAM